MSADPYNAVLIDRDDVTDSLSFFRVRPESDSLPSFEPGQFANLGLLEEPPEQGAADGGSQKPAKAKLVRRPYSIGSACHESEHLELYIVRVPGGRFTERLWALRPGDRLWLGPRLLGELTLKHVPPGKRLLMIGTGTGVAPYVSMLRSYAPAGQATDLWERFVLVHGVRHAAELAYHQEMTHRAEVDQRFAYLPTVTREPQDGPWRGLRGRVQTLLDHPTLTDALGGPVEPQDTEVFLCGNPEMIDQMEQTLHERGFVTRTIRQPGNLHLERYW